MCRGVAVHAARAPLDARDPPPRLRHEPAAPCYWGDIDTHGFAILDAPRARFGHVESFLMDRGTLMAFETMWGTEDRPIHRDLPRLTAEERALYDDLRANRFGRHVRLEQNGSGSAGSGMRWRDSEPAHP